MRTYQKHLMRKYNERIKKKVTMYEMKLKEDFMKVRIKLRIFVQHSVKFRLWKITRILCELLTHQKMRNTKNVNVI